MPGVASPGSAFTLRSDPEVFPLLHPDTRLVFLDESIGYGVVATRRLPMGTVTWVRDPLDQEWDERPSLDRGPWQQLFERYSYITGTGRRLMCWDFTRFMNHSCDATCFLVGDDFEIAVRDIEVGEPLTSDYATLNVEQDFECLCRQPNCRGIVGSRDLEARADEWDVVIRRALALGLDLPQPLEQWHRDWSSVEMLMRDPKSAPSIRTRAWPPTPAVENA